MLFNVKIWEPKIFLNWHQHFLVTTELPVICRIHIPINNKLRIRMRPLDFTENCHKKLKYMQEDFYLKFFNKISGFNKGLSGTFLSLKKSL